jgi:hypothetical protein
MAADTSDTFPARPVRWIVPFPPAGSIDLVGRVVGQKLYDLWNQQVVIDNRAGGGGRLGTQLAAGSAADGYTQLFRSTHRSPSIVVCSKVSPTTRQGLRADNDHRIDVPVTCHESIVPGEKRARIDRAVQSKSGTSELRIIGHWRVAASRHGTIPLNDRHRHRARAV